MSKIGTSDGYMTSKNDKDKSFYTRSVKGGGMSIKQLVTPKHVLSYSNNKSASNGEKGRKLEIKKRKDTNL